jgi:hypothetical protein
MLLRGKVVVGPLYQPKEDEIVLVPHAEPSRPPLMGKEDLRELSRPIDSV